MKNNLTILLAPDSFKESMTAKEACQAIERGIKKANSLSNGVDNVKIEFSDIYTL